MHKCEFEHVCLQTYIHISTYIHVQIYDMSKYKMIASAPERLGNGGTVGGAGCGASIFVFNCSSSAILCCTNRCSSCCSNWGDWNTFVWRTVMCLQVLQRERERLDYWCDEIHVLSLTSLRKCLCSENCDVFAIAAEAEGEIGSLVWWNTCVIASLLKCLCSENWDVFACAAEGEREIRSLAWWHTSVVVLLLIWVLGELACWNTCIVALLLKWVLGE